MPEMRETGLSVVALSIERQRIADEIVRRCDTVVLLTCEEVRDIWSRAQQGDFDDITIAL